MWEVGGEGDFSIHVLSSYLQFINYLVIEAGLAKLPSLLIRRYIRTVAGKMDPPLKTHVVAIAIRSFIP
jgi:hypothetical protein